MCDWWFAQWFVKLGGFLHVMPGFGWWAAGVLTVAFKLIASPDVHHLWNLTKSEVRP